MLACSARMDCEYYGALCIKYFRHAAATACAVLVNIASSRSALPQLSDVCLGRFLLTSFIFLFCPRCSYRTSAVFALKNYNRRKISHGFPSKKNFWMITMLAMLAMLQLPLASDQFPAKNSAHWIGRWCSR